MKVQFMSMRNMVLKSLYTILLSAVVFSVCKLEKELYLSFVIGLWGILLISFDCKKNLKFYDEIVTVFLANLGVYVIVKAIQCWPVNLDVVHVGYVIYGAALIGLWIACKGALLREHNVEKCKTADETQKAVLFQERTYDLKRIGQYLEASDTVGIDAGWGVGKSFILNELQRQPMIKERYVFVEVNLLACNLDEIQSILLEKMDAVLREHRIFSRYSRRLKLLLAEKGILNDLGHIFVSDEEPFSEALAGLSKEIERMDKSIVIVYEDLDRIQNPDTIRKILSISENLVGGRIKVLYQYDEQELEHKDPGLNHSYLEKYIPYTVRLTEIEFFHILQYVLEENKEYEQFFKVDDFNHLWLPIYPDHYLRKMGVERTFHLKIRNVSVRKMEHFLHELFVILKNNPMYQQEKYKKDVITFFVLKHFMHEYYNELVPEQSLLDTFLITYKEKKYGILELIGLNKREKIEDFDQLFLSDDNRDALTLISLFGYRLDVDNSVPQMDQMTAGVKNNVTNQALNDQKNHLLWNLIANGEAEYSNSKMAVDMMWNQVLQLPEDQRQEAFEQYGTKFFYNKFEKAGSGTIFRFGHSAFTDLFPAFWGAEASTKQWIAFLEFYFAYGHHHNQKIDPTLIYHLNYVDLRHKKVYLFVLEHFNSLEIIGNMNAQKSYKTFLINYLRALSGLQYTDTFELEILEAESGEGIQSVDLIQTYVLDKLERKIDLVRRKMERLPEIKRELDLIIDFIKKNCELMNHEQPCKVPAPEVRSSMSSRMRNQEEFDRLNNLDLPYEEFLQAVRDSYHSGKISIYEIDRLERMQLE
jgi:hypothetical protein